jgi:hypothetical protein
MGNDETHLTLCTEANMNEALEHIAEECSPNPLYHFLQTSLEVPECKPEELTLAVDDDDLLPDASYILSLPAQTEHAKVNQKYLQSQGFRNVKVWPGVNGSDAYSLTDYSFKLTRTGAGGAVKMVASSWFDAKRQTTTHPFKNDGFVTRGERGYRASMLSVFLDAVSRDDINSIMVMDYDVVFHCQFKQRLIELLRCPRCGHHVSRGTSNGGLLLLGATVWLDEPDDPLDDTLDVPFGGWPSIDQDLQARRQEYPESSIKCFNVQLCTLGSFAVIYHRHSFQFVIDFLTQPLQKPFDHIYPFLVSKDIIVRAAHPYLTAADVSHASSVDSSRSNDVFLRLQRHRWDPEAFCHPGTQQRFYQIVRPQVSP